MGVGEAVEDGELGQSPHCSRGRVEWEGMPDTGLAASSKVTPSTPTLGRSRGSAGEIKRPRKVEQGSSRSKRLERKLSFKSVTA